jgi:hypothetical protein
MNSVCLPSEAIYNFRQPPFLRQEIGSGRVVNCVDVALDVYFVNAVMMVHSCCAVNCTNRFSKASGLRFYK